MLIKSITIKCFPAHDKLGACRTSFVSPEQPVLCNPVSPTKPIGTGHFWVVACSMSAVSQCLYARPNKSDIVSGTCIVNKYHCADRRSTTNMAGACSLLNYQKCKLCTFELSSSLPAVIDCQQEKQSFTNQIKAKGNSDEPTTCAHVCLPCRSILQQLMW